MDLDIARIHTILADCAGEVDENERPIEGCELFNFFVVAFAMRTDKVHEHAAEMIELLKEWPSESWGQPVPPLGEEINYLIAGAVLDDQFRAFALFAFGKIADWWDILDPHTVFGMEYDDPQGYQLAGRGMVAITGYRAEVNA
jgi:hypothetical protein